MSVTIKTPSGLVQTAGNAKSVDIATTDKVGVVKPDGSTITIDSDGTIHSIGGGGGTSNYLELRNLPQINSETLVGNKTAEDLGLARNNIAVKDIPGLVAIDSETMNIDEYGNISPRVDTSFSPTSTRPIANKTVFSELINKADNILASEKYNGLMSSSDKVKLDGIQENATATEIDQKTVVLSSSGWANNQQTITDEDVTLDAMVFIDYGGVSGITCEQASGSLIFKVEEVPTENITLKVGIVKGNGTASDNLIKTKTVNISSISGWTSNYKEFGWSTYGIDTSKEEILSVGIINYTGNCVLTTLIGGSNFYVLTTSTSVTPTNVQLKVIYRNK